MNATSTSMAGKSRRAAPLGLVRTVARPKLITMPSMSIDRARSGVSDSERPGVSSEPSIVVGGSFNPAENPVR
jgi:hypothetical protein